MIKPADELTRKSNLDLISDGIEQANNNKNRRFLDLYKYCPNWQGYHRPIKTYNYTDDDLNELTKLGYLVDVSERKEIYSGMLWWRKLEKTILFHTIYW